MSLESSMILDPSVPENAGLVMHCRRVGRGWRAIHAAPIAQIAPATGLSVTVKTRIGGGCSRDLRLGMLRSLLRMGEAGNGNCGGGAETEGEYDQRPGRRSIFCGHGVFS
jgi:hypothetical protein